MEVRLVREEDPTKVIPVEATEEPGELQIRGRNLFEGYWGMPEMTKDSFTEDRWFKTGDVAQTIGVNDTNLKYYQILGRQSTDIIKVLDK